LIPFVSWWVAKLWIRVESTPCAASRKTNRTAVGQARPWRRGWFKPKASHSRGCLCLFRAGTTNAVSERVFS